MLLLNLFQGRRFCDQLKIIESLTHLSQLQPFSFGMKLLHNLLELIKLCDFFKSSKLIRYQGQHQYKTTTGGIFSLGIIIAILIGFASMIMDTLNRTTITYTLDIINRNDPILTTLKNSPQQNFMFAVSMDGLDLNKGKRFLDVMALVYRAESTNMTQQYFPLQQCTKQHWSHLPDVVERFDRLKIDNWLCPYINSSLDFYGKRSSSNSQWMVLTVMKCSNLTDPDRPCASPDQIQNFTKMAQNVYYLTLYYTRSIINPNQPNYISYSLQDRSLMMFGPEIGIFSMFQITDFAMQTDTSIWPYSSFQKATGFFIQDNVFVNPYQVVQGKPYLICNIVKSSRSLLYDRQVQKISSVFSFIGGLIGAILAVMFLLATYTNFSYQISIAFQLFKESARGLQQQLKKGIGINIISYLKHLIFQIFSNLFKEIEWPAIKYLHECRSQILEQLDVKSLIERIIFMEYCMEHLLEEHHIDGLQMSRPNSLSEIRLMRMRLLKAKSDQEEGKQVTDQVQMQKIDKSGLQTPSQFKDISNLQSFFKLESIRLSLSRQKKYIDKSPQADFNTRKDNSTKQIDKHIHCDIINQFSQNTQQSQQMPNHNKQQNFGQFPQHLWKESNSNDFGFNQRVKNQKRSQRISILQKSALQGDEISKKILFSLKNKQCSSKAVDLWTKQ